MDERLKKQLSFILEIDKEKSILRQTELSDGSRRENDAEHAWHMAVMLYLLKEHANEPFDLAKAMMMALIHDVVEIDAGDTYAYDEAAIATQREREEIAAERLFGLLPAEQGKELRDLFEEYERCDSPEAHIVRTMDTLQPLLLTDANGGGSWRAHGVASEKIRRRQDKSKLGSERLWQQAMDIIDRNVKEGKLAE